MLTIERPSHITHHDDKAAGDQSEQERSHFESAVLNAYGIIPAHGCCSSSQGKSVVYLKPRVIRSKGSEPVFNMQNETARSKRGKIDWMSINLIPNPFSPGQPWQGSWTAAEGRTKEYEKDVLKAFGIVL